MRVAYIIQEVKPKSKSALIAGINEFWDTVTIEKCQKYIGQFRKDMKRFGVRESCNRLLTLWKPYCMFYILFSEQFYDL